MTGYEDWAYEGYAESSTKLVKRILAAVILPLTIIASLYLSQDTEIYSVNNEKSLEFIVRN